MVEVCTRSVDTGFVALGYAKVAILCVVRGITELLPISSAAHIPPLLGAVGQRKRFRGHIMGALWRLINVGPNSAQFYSLTTGKFYLLRNALWLRSLFMDMIECPRGQVKAHSQAQVYIV